MRKSHRQKVVDRREKRQRRRKLVAKLKEMIPVDFAEACRRAHLREQARRMDEMIQSYIPKEGDGERIIIIPRKAVKRLREAANAAGKAFISALVASVGSAESATKFLSSMKSLNPGLIEMLACPDCEGTGWSYHEHLPIERHVGCEDCGGCGDERGTGIAP